MPIEDILYQVYLLILSWPVNGEATIDSSVPADMDGNGPAEPDML